MKKVNKPPEKEKVFCLFHKTYDCVCVKPVTDEEALKPRIESQERLNKLKEKYGF